MLKRNWIIVAALGVTLTLLVASGGYQIWLYQSEHADQRDDASKYKAETAEQYLEICVRDADTIFSVFGCAIESAEASREAQRSKYDLQAQQDMAEWALLIVWLTAIGISVSVAGLVALYWSLTQTKMAIKDTREIGEAQTRAYVDIVDIVYRVRSDTLIVKGKFRNTGPSPAIEFKAIPKLGIGIPMFDAFRPELPKLVARQESFTATWNDAAVGYEGISHIFKGGTEWRVHIRIKWADVFGKTNSIEATLIAIDGLTLPDKNHFRTGHMSVSYHSAKYGQEPNKE